MMSEPNSPMEENEERVFRFISDPGHKENLSGRVRAACLTCRRKKIKCSGEINCRTCREKGVVCEGLSERKRPSKDTGSPKLALDPVPSGIERKRRISPPKKVSLRRPSVTLKQTDSSDSYDSGYSSHRGDATNSMSSSSTLDAVTKSGVEASQSEFKLHSHAPKAARNNIRSRDLHIDTWHLNDQHFELAQNSDYDLSAVEPLSAISSQYQADSAATFATSLDWEHFQQNELWWAEQSLGHGQDLVSTAQVLEDQTRALNMTANHQPYVETASIATRRQTIAFPLESFSASASHYGTLEHQHGILDDMAVLAPSRTPRTGLTPNLTEFASWWDINGVGDFASVFGNNTKFSLSESLPEQQALFYNEEQTTQSVQEGAQSPTAPDTGCFAQYWYD